MCHGKASSTEAASESGSSNAAMAGVAVGVVLVVGLAVLFVAYKIRQDEKEPSGKLSTSLHNKGAGSPHVEMGRYAVFNRMVWSGVGHSFWISSWC